MDLRNAVDLLLHSRSVPSNNISSGQNCVNPIRSGKHSLCTHCFSSTTFYKGFVKCNGWTGLAGRG